MLHEITLKIAFQDSDNEACETRVTLKTDETFDHSFRHMEVLCGKKKGSIAFAYKRKWLEQTDTPQELGLQDGDVIDCVSVIILVIVRADARSRYFTADPSDVSLTFSTLFASYGTISNTDPGALQFTHNGTPLRPTDLVVATLGESNDDGFILVATAPSNQSVQANCTQPASAMESPVTMLARLQLPHLKAEAHRLDALIRSWPDHPAPLEQDDSNMLWDFACQFMVWRDPAAQPPPDTNMSTNVNQQMAELETLYEEWKTGLLHEWKAANLNPAGSFDSLQNAIQANAMQRLLREARLVWVFGLLVDSWKARVSRGLPFPWGGPGLDTDLRILRECSRAGGGEMALLESGKADVVNTLSSAVPSKPSALLVNEPIHADVDVNVDVEPPPRRNPRRGRQPIPEPVKKGTPPAPEPRRERRPEFVRRPNTLPHLTALSTRRQLIQHEWNKLARAAGAASLEFVNDVDDEELPPGISVLFPYLEREYLFDIGIADATPLAGCACDGMTVCADDGTVCTCQAGSEDGPAYTPEGLFTFDRDSEIVECNNVCECPPKCVNRVAQFPRRVPIQIFKTEKRGWGARAPVDLVRGRVLGLYTGLLIRREEADKLSGSRASYCFDLDVNEDPGEEPPENAYSVDAFGCGNWTRFINHSCAPNLQIFSVVYDTMPEDNIHYLAFVATQNIPAYTELTFDYNPAHQIAWELKRYREKSRSKKNKSKTQTRCLCGSSQCRAWLSVAA